MTISGKILFAILVIVHFTACYRPLLLIVESKTQNRRTKFVYMLAVLFIPILGNIIIRSLLKSDFTNAEIKELRKQDMDKNGNHPSFQSHYTHGS